MGLAGVLAELLRQDWSIMVVSGLWSAFLYELNTINYKQKTWCLGLTGLTGLVVKGLGFPFGATGIV